MRPDLAEYLGRGGVGTDSAIYKAAVRIQSRYRGYVVRKVSLMISLKHPKMQAIHSAMLCILRRFQQKI
jgi:uncharacterized protein YchJ